jgi:ResB-like family
VNEATSSPLRPQANVLNRVLGTLGSFHIACVNFAFIFIVTLVGTIYQKESLLGLYDCQRYYFESWIVPREGWVWGWLPLPGMALLFAVMFVNILAGGILRIRKNRRTIGVVISHCSILGFIVAGAVSLWTKKEGHMVIFEKSSDSIVKSPSDWVLEVRELRGTDGREPVEKKIRYIKSKHFEEFSGDQSCVFNSQSWPFSVAVSRYTRNAEILMEGHPGIRQDAPKAGGYAIRELKVNPTNELNISAAKLEIKDRSGGSLGTTLTFGDEKAPFIFSAGERRFSIGMTREQWEVPFKVHLDDFRAEYYPGTRKARSYESDIRVQHANGNESKHLIWMNNPLRDSGYVAYQTNYDQQSPPGKERYSVLTVVKNRTDHWPLIMLIVCTIGLLIHFLYKLFSFLSRSAKTAAPPAAPAAPTVSA